MFENILKSKTMENPKNTYYPNIKQAIGILLLFIFLSMVFGLITSLGSLVDNKLLQDITLLVSYTMAAGGTVIIIVRMKKSQDTDIPVFMNHKPKTKTFIVTLLLTIAVIIVTEPLANVIPMPDSIKDLFETMFRPTIPAFLTAVIVAPILEEMIFRGIILEGFLRNYSPVKSILLVSLLFGLAHLNIWQFIGAFIIGAFISWIYWKTRNLLLSIAVHMLNNLISYLAMLFSSKSVTDTTIVDFTGNIEIYYALFGLSIVLLVLGFLYHKTWIEKKMTFPDKN